MYKLILSSIMVLVTIICQVNGMCPSDEKIFCKQDFVGVVHVYGSQRHSLFLKKFDYETRVYKIYKEPFHLLGARLTVTSASMFNMCNVSMEIDRPYLISGNFVKNFDGTRDMKTLALNCCSFNFEYYTMSLDRLINIRKGFDCEKTDRKEIRCNSCL